MHGQTAIMGKVLMERKGSKSCASRLSALLTNPAAREPRAGRPMSNVPGNFLPPVSYYRYSSAG